MTKRALKARVAAVQNDECALTGDPLSDNQSLNDADRITPKADGGDLVRPNIRIVQPVAHMELHGNLRLRAELHEKLKSYVDDRTQVMRLRNKINNQKLAIERRTDHGNPETIQWLDSQLAPVDETLADRSKRVERCVEDLSEQDPFIALTMKVPYLGPITVAHLSVYLDLTKCAGASSAWKYTGLHVASHERYVKGVKGGGNKTLRTALWNSANVMVRSKGSLYRPLYDSIKAKLAISERIVKTRNTAGHLVEVAWKDAKPSHRHGAGLRAVMKAILADYWFAGRTMAGLSTEPITPKDGEPVVNEPHLTRENVRLRGWQLPLEADPT